MDQPNPRIAHAALAVPEILRLICEMLTKSDQARLLTLSRRFFTCIVSLVWNTISGHKALLGLLPTIDWARVQNAISVRNQIQPLDHRALLRFNLYAPHVRQFQPDYELGKFWGILLKAVPTRPIFPNLQVLGLSRMFPYLKTELISQLNAFLCPALTELRCPGPFGQMLDTLQASQLSASLVQHCPNIHTLDIYTGYTYALDLIPTFGPPVPSSPDLPTSLAQFHNLRHLGGGPEFLSPEALVALGRLPLLESFTIAYSYKAPKSFVQSNLSMPHDDFHALRHLGIYCYNRIEHASELWKLPSLVQQLVSVHVDVDSASASDEQIRQLICLICKNSPLVSELHIDLEATIGRENIDLLSPTVISHLQRLPLRRLRIMASHPRLTPIVDFERLAFALSNTEYLNMQCYRINFEDLVLIAKHMSKLRFLAVSLSPFVWPPKDQLPRLPTSDPPLFIVFRHKDRHLLEADVKSTSLALHSLWPNGVYCGLPGDAEADLCAHEELELINTEIQKLCPLKALGVHSFDDLTLEWKYANKRRIPWLKVLY